MSSQIKIVFGSLQEYELTGHTTLSREAANHWLNEQWEILECEPANPMGKVLLLDKILCVAKYGGEQRFATPDAWAQTYADAVTVLLERPVVRVDVAARVVG